MYKRQLEQSVAKVFQHLFFLPLLNSLGSGSPLLCRRGEGRLPPPCGAASGSAGREIPRGDAGRASLRRAREKIARRRSRHSRGTGETHALGLFCFATWGKVFAVGFVPENFQRPPCRQRGSSLPGKHLPASAFQHFSCMNVNRRPPGLSSEPCPPVPPFGKAIPLRRRRDRQGQAAATPACAGRGNSTLIPPAAAKGRGSRPLSCPIPVFWGARSLPLLPPGGSWTFTPAPKSRPPTLVHT